LRPSILAKELGDYDVVNVGAAGHARGEKPWTARRVSFEPASKASSRGCGCDLRWP
jgi:hypothetical protein